MLSLSALPNTLSSLLAEKASLIATPRYLYRVRAKVIRAENAFLEEHGGRPAEVELAALLGMTRVQMQHVRAS